MGPIQNHEGFYRANLPTGFQMRRERKRRERVTKLSKKENVSRIVAQKGAHGI
jgi:hypothetical protein